MLKNAKKVLKYKIKKQQKIKIQFVRVEAATKKIKIKR